MRIEDLIPEFREYRPPPFNEATLFLAYSKALDVRLVKKAVYFSLLRVSDIVEAILHLEGFGLHVESLRTQVCFEDAEQVDAWSRATFDLFEKCPDHSDFEADTLAELRLLCEGLVSAEPAVFLDADGAEYSRFGCESAIIGIAESLAGVRDQFFVEGAGWVDGMWEFSSIVRRSQWAALDCLANPGGDDILFNIGFGVSQGVRVKLGRLRTLLVARDPRSQ